MAPSDKTVLDSIKYTVRNLFQGPDRNELTVNNVRSQVEAALQLDSGFLKEGSWKQKSKELVKAEYVRSISARISGAQSLNHDRRRGYSS
jgi:hypothetical protein